MPKDALTRRRGRRPAGFCQEQTDIFLDDGRLPNVLDTIALTAANRPPFRSFRKNSFPGFLRIDDHRPSICRALGI